MKKLENFNFFSLLKEENKNEEKKLEVKSKEESPILRRIQVGSVVLKGSIPFFFVS